MRGNRAERIRRLPRFFGCFFVLTRMDAILMLKKKNGSGGMALSRWYFLVELGGIEPPTSSMPRKIFYDSAISCR